MGLLDDAIREHLELKRRSGADPGAIAQAEHEALDPIFPDEPDTFASDEPLAEDAVAQHAVAEPAAPEHAEQVRGEEATDFSAVGQETAELDMRTVLEQPLADAPPQTAAARPVRAFSTARDATEEELEWEVASSPQEPVPEEIPGQERLTFE